MKIAFVLTQDRGGPVDLTVSLARELAGRPGGPEVVLLGPASMSSARLPSTCFHPVLVRSKLDVRGFSAVSKLLGDLAPDIVHAQDHRAGLVVSLAADRQVPVVMTFHGVPDSAAGRWVTDGPWRGRRLGVAGTSRLVAQALLARRLLCTVAPSRAIAQFLHRELRVPLGRVRILHNGVPVSPVLPRRRSTGVQTFATAGSFAPCKAAPLLVEAFSAVAADHTGLSLTMIGDGDDRLRCEQLARQRGSRVDFLGYRTDVEAQLGRADAFVLPSLNENLPLALLQAMAMGLPCIATDVGGIREVLDEDCGIVIPPGDVSALREAMEQLVTAPDRAARMGISARERVAERFSMDRCADEHMRLWTDVLGEVF